MSECTHDCSSCGESCGSRNQPESLLEKPHEQSHIKKVIGISSGKGGVGKSMVTALLAVLAQRQGLKVGILDADITGPSIPRAFGLTEQATGSESGLFPVRTQTGIDVMSLNLLLENPSDPVVWRGPVITGAVKQFWTDVIWGDKDILFIDMPPGTGDVMLTVFQSIPVDAVVLVTTPQELVGMIVEKAIKMTGMMNIPTLGIVEALAKTYNIPYAARLPIDTKLSSGMDKGMIELFTGDWLDGLANAMIDLKPQQRV